MFLQLTIGGLMLGSVYALVALGYSLIYSSSGLMTFVQGDMFMLGGFLIYTFSVMMDFPLLLAVLLSLAVMFAVGGGTEKGVISPLQKLGASGINIVLATIALSTLLQNIAMLGWGTSVFNVPAMFGDTIVKIMGVSVTYQQIGIMVVAFICMLILHFFMNETRMGISMRAAAMDRTAASSVGINVPGTIAVTWGIACVLAALGGLLLAPIYGVYAKMGAIVSSKGFAAAVVGGYGNMYGAMVGGLLLGLVETFAAGYISSAIKDIVCYLILILVMFVKPSGIFNGKVLAN